MTLSRRVDIFTDIPGDRLRLDKTLGYLYFIDKDCPLASGNSYRVYYHRYVVSAYLKEWLAKEDIVHHIDGNKLNNSIDNLEIMSQPEHVSLHMSTLTNKMCECCGLQYRPNKATQRFCSTKCVQTHSSKGSSNITIELIEYWVSNFSWLRASKELGLSDNGLRKRYTSLTGLSPKTIKKL